MTLFDRALPFILKFEGGYVNDPQDPGGATNFGITQATYDGWNTARGRPRRPVFQIDMPEVQEIYLKRFWLRGHCDILPWPLALIHFDCCVNVGTESRDGLGRPKTSAITLLQRALGVVDDGLWGPITATFARTATPITCYRYVVKRMIYYIHLDDKHPERLKFFNSWLGRLEVMDNEVENL